MHRIVLFLVIAILALAVVGCSGSDEAETAEMTENPTVLATLETTSTLVSTALPTNTLPISTAAPTNTLPISTAAPTNTLPIQSVVNTEANLRAGPGAEYDKITIASEGQVVELIGTNAANDWYKLASGEWIAAFLVDNPPDELPVALDILPQVALEPAPTSPLPISTAPPTNTLPIQSVVNTEANLRAGPGTEYDKIRIVSVGQVVELIGTNPANDWYKLASGEWIAAFLVDNPPDDLPVALDILPQVTQESPPTPVSQAIGAEVRIIGMLRNGRKGENEPDEYVEIANVGDTPLYMTGWRLESERRGDDSGQIFYFPQGFLILPSEICRIYTNQDDPEWCGLNFRHEGAIWSNYDPDAALLYDQAGNLVSRWE